MRFRLISIAMTLALLMLLVASALAEILLCISNQELKGEQTVASCVDKGEQFAMVDEYGFVKILTSEEIALTRALNLKVFQTRAFGFKYRQLASQIPPLPVPPEAG